MIRPGRDPIRPRSAKIRSLIPLAGAKAPTTPIPILSDPKFFLPPDHALTQPNVAIPPPTRPPCQTKPQLAIPYAPQPKRLSHRQANLTLPI
jgi:hypothetical protein